MDPLTWTGSLGTLLNPIFVIGVVVLIVALIGNFAASFASSTQEVAAAGGAVVTPWRWTDKTSLFELVIPAIAIALVLFAFEAASSEVTLRDWLAQFDMPGILKLILPLAFFLLLGGIVAYAMQRLPRGIV